MRRFEQLAMLIAVAVFLVLYLGFKWSFIISLIISMGLLAAAFILLEPVPKIGDTILLNVKDAERIKGIYEEAELKIEQIQNIAEQVKNQEIKTSSIELTETGQTIMKYLEKYPKKISSVEHFLDYYVETAYKILSHYQELESLEKRPDKLVRLQDETAESIAYLNYIFDQHYEGLQKQTLNELTLENELLETTLQNTAEEIANMRKSDKEKV